MSGQGDTPPSVGADVTSAPPVPDPGASPGSGRTSTSTGSAAGNPHADDAAAAVANAAGVKDDDPPQGAGTTSPDASGEVTLNANNAVGADDQANPGGISGASTAADAQLTQSQLNARAIAALTVQGQDMTGRMDAMMGLLQQLLGAQPPPSTASSVSSDLSPDDLSLRQADVNGRLMAQAYTSSMTHTGKAQQADSTVTQHPKLST